MTGEIIQIVEDEGLIALHLTEILEKAGYRVLDPAYSGEMALRVLELFPIPGLILMDIGLGGSLDGIETARQIQKRFTVPLIFITAYTSENLLARMLEVAPEGVITKPFVDTDLLDLVGKALSHAAT
ncbi:response regulator [Methanoregula sp.]|uniref:response regulator n=1 Tax=Methanoregula sp. TaxID=2052170 RepID=UPI003BB01664